MCDVRCCVGVHACDVVCVCMHVMCLSMCVMCVMCACMHACMHVWVCCCVCVCTASKGDRESRKIAVVDSNKSKSLDQIKGRVELALSSLSLSWCHAKKKMHTRKRRKQSATTRKCHTKVKKKKEPKSKSTTINAEQKKVSARMRWLEMEGEVGGCVAGRVENAGIVRTSQKINTKSPPPCCLCWKLLLDSVLFKRRKKTHLEQGWG